MSLKNTNTYLSNNRTNMIICKTVPKLKKKNV